MKIMFICTGNICRSAMAHRLLEKKLKDLNRKDIEVYSAGIYAEQGEKSPFYAIDVMDDYEVDLKKHRATHIRNSNIKECDLILCAVNAHKIEILDIYPELEGKVFALKEYVGYDREYHHKINIQDPWGCDLETYRSCAGEIDECLEMLLNKI